MADSTQQVQSMVNFITSEAKDRAEEIEAKALEDFNVMKLKELQLLKTKARADIQRKEKQIQTQRAIARSTAVNRSRLEKIGERNKRLNDLSGDVALKLSQVTANAAEYKKLIVDLIAQGALALLETNLTVQCRQKDKAVVQGALADAQAKYSGQIKAQAGVDMQVKLTLDEKSWLPETKLGGVVLACHNGQITVDNTLDARLHLVMENDKPSIRAQLFPTK
jgi:V-type H+-transporting ATPase subunit E